MNRYQPIPIIKLEGKRAYQNARYPEVPLSDNDIYVYTVQGDRWDLLANQYYNDSSLWWIISIANSTLNQSSLVIPEGIQIRIPSDWASVVNSFKKLNN